MTSSLTSKNYTKKTHSNKGLNAIDAMIRLSFLLLLHIVSNAQNCTLPDQFPEATTYGNYSQVTGVVFAALIDLVGVETPIAARGFLAVSTNLWYVLFFHFVTQ